MLWLAHEASVKLEESFSNTYSEKNASIYLALKLASAQNGYDIFWEKRNEERRNEDIKTNVKKWHIINKLGTLY